jgi:ankyrin repeat protein
MIMKKYLLLSLLCLMATVGGQVDGVDTENQNVKVFEDMSLSTAASVGDIATLEHLIKSGVDVNKKDGWLYEETPLHHAVHNLPNGEKNDEVSYELAKLLLGAGADVKARNNLGETPLHIAIKWCYEKAADLLIRAGSDIHAKDNKGNTPLHYAARQKYHCRNVEILLNAGAATDINATNDDGETPLHLAVNCYNYYLFDEKVIEMLLKAGADVSAKDNYGRTPIDIAESSSPYELQKKVAIQKLITAAPKSGTTGVDDSRYKTNAGTFCTRANSRSRWSPEDNDYKKRFPLHRAVRIDDGSEVKRLIVSGIDVNEKDCRGFTTLHFATLSLDIAQLLIDAGAQVNARSGSIVGRTALHNAAVAGFEPLVSMLLNAGADVNAIDSNGMTPLDLVYWLLEEYSGYFHSEEEQRYNSIIAMLRDAGGMTSRYLKFSNIMWTAARATSIVIPPVIVALQLLMGYWIRHYRNNDVDIRLATALSLLHEKTFGSVTDNVPQLGDLVLDYLGKNID